MAFDVKKFVLAAATLALAACGPSLSNRSPAPQASLPTPTPSGPASVTDLAPPELRTAKVAVLLPLSGDNAQLGEAMLNAAQLALFEIAPPTLELLPRDAGGSPDTAQAALEDALGEGAEFVIGPVFAGQTAALRPQALRAGAPMVAFTNDWTTLGNGVYSLGFLPFEQVDRVVGYAASQGRRNLAVLAPNTAYGAAVVDSAYETMGRIGGQVVAVQRYDDPAGADAAIRALLATPGVDALLIPEGGPRLAALAQRLQGAGFDPSRVKPLGLGTWDDPAVARLPVLAGGWFAAPDPAARAAFERSYQAAYGAPPPRLAALSYDAVALAGVLAQASADAPFDQAALTQPNGFGGVEGLFRLLPSGRAERRLAVMEIRPEGLIVADPAPTSFEPQTF